MHSTPLTATACASICVTYHHSSHYATHAPLQRPNEKRRQPQLRLQRVPCLRLRPHLRRVVAPAATGMMALFTVTGFRIWARRTTILRLCAAASLAESSSRRSPVGGRHADDDQLCKLSELYFSACYSENCVFSPKNAQCSWDGSHDKIALASLRNWYPDTSAATAGTGRMGHVSSNDRGFRFKAANPRALLDP